MLRHMRGTLNSSNADSVHTLIFTTILYTLYTIAILKHLEALIFKNYICVVALTPNSRKVSFRTLADFLLNSTTVKVLQLLIFIKRSYQSLRTLLRCRKLLSISYLLLRANSCRVATPISTRDWNDRQSWLTLQ
jgi:hypothetical protein